MRRTGKLLLLAAFLAAVSATFGCDPPPVEHYVETIVEHEDLTVFSLPELTSQRIVGTVNVTQQGTAMRIRVSSSPGQRLADVRVCVMPESTRVQCLNWIGPEDIDATGHEFEVDLDNLQPQICTVRYRILLRYRIVPVSG